MLTDEIIEDFFNAIDDSNINVINTLLSSYPSIVLSNPYDDGLAFQAANIALTLSQNMFKTNPTPAGQEILGESIQANKIIHDATVLYALNNNDTNLMQYMYDHHSSPYITLSNGIDPLKYAIDNGKTEAENWIRNQFKKGSEQFKALGPNPFSNLFGLTEDKKQQIEELKMQKQAELLALSSSTAKKVSEAKIPAPTPTPTIFAQPNNGTLFSSSRTLEEQQALLQFQRTSALMDVGMSTINSLLAAAKK